MYHVYMVTRAGSSKAYVGKAKDVLRRWHAHVYRASIGCGDALYAAIRKYGRDAFNVQVLQTYATEVDAFDGERFWTGVLGTIAPYGYNIKLGGRGGWSHAPESREKIAAKGRGRVPSNAARAKLSAALKGRKPSPEAMRRAREVRTGKQHTAEAKAKMSAAQRGRSRRPFAQKASA
jgi:group I intron endonuclease